ncbi:2-amino-4-hydroxy-6-hydroxymethyldihydropteridine diphosphokinase [Promineifilum sp.]|uniref:2-amino-4-hydroxy-6- hydroxymethyldihydropteridine diphosphokinase n=1 Tax=Promineifilum sp. TaxID=2664178 RepID=UPI0035AF0B5C
MSRLYLSLGSNLNERYANLRRAIALLREHMSVTAISPVYATEPWGDKNQPPFLNICVAASTTLAPHDVLHLIKSIETEMGRQPSHRWGPRLIDIDIVFYDNLVLHDEELMVPHPRLAERAFVLAPLADLIPDFRHPQTGETVQELLDRVGADGVERLFEMEYPVGSQKAKSTEMAG